MVAPPHAVGPGKLGRGGFEVAYQALPGSSADKALEPPETVETNLPTVKLSTGTWGRGPLVDLLRETGAAASRAGPGKLGRRDGLVVRTQGSAPDRRTLKPLDTVPGLGRTSRCWAEFSLVVCGSAQTPVTGAPGVPACRRATGRTAR